MRRNKISKVVGAALCSLTASGVAAYETGDGIRVGDGTARLHAGVDVKEAYDDNIYATNVDTVGSLISHLKPYFGFEATRQDSFYSADIYADGAFYASAGANDHVDWALSVLINEVFNSRNRLDIDLEVGRYTEDRSFEDQSILPRYNGQKGGIQYGFGSKEAFFNFDVYARYAERQYNRDNTSRDSQDAKFGGIGYFQVAPATDAVLELRHSNLQYTNDEDSDVKVNTVLVGVKWEATAKTQGHVKVGAQRQSGRDGDDRTRPSWEVGVTWLPQTYTVFAFTTEQGFGLDSQSGQYSQYTRAGITWDNTWSQKWSTNVGVAFQDEDLLASSGTGFNPGELLLNRQTQEYTASVQYQAARWADVSAGYTYSNRDATDEGRAANNNDIYSRNYVFVGVNFGL